MSESMVTIPLKEYEELKRTKETLKTKGCAVFSYKSRDGIEYGVYTESESVVELAKIIAQQSKDIGAYREQFRLAVDGKIKSRDLILW